MALEIRFTGGMNNNDNPIELFLRKRGETQTLVNADVTQRGRLKFLRPLLALNSVAESSSIHSLYCIQNLPLLGVGTELKYLNGTAISNIISGLSGDSISFHHAGNWVYLSDGTNRRSVYVITISPTGCSWGQAIPTTAPTVAAGAGGNPDGTYSCYYRYKITLPDGTIIRTSVSPVGTVVVTADKIEWSALVHSTFSGATTREIELFRTKTGFAGTYLVTTISEGTTTYSDDIADVALQGNTEYAEDGYYPPPDSVDIVFYHSGSDRMFVTVGNAIYWSEAGLYHIFMYNEASDLYENTNEVFLEGEDISGLQTWDEQLYIGSRNTWKRLRGYNPDYWSWDDTSAIKGPISQESLVRTPWGLLYPGNDGHLWMFNGLDARRFAEEFIFGVNPTSVSHATFDGRYYRLFYGDPVHPELIIDFGMMPNLPPKIIKSTRTATSSFYDNSENVLYFGTSDGYIKALDDESSEVALSFLTAEVPIDGIVKLGDASCLMVEANTGGHELVVTQYEDGKPSTELTPVVTTELERVAVPMAFNTYRTISFGVTITGNSENMELKEPWFLSNEDDG